MRDKYCVYCVNTDGSLKSYEEILEETVHHLMEWQGIEASVAKKNGIRDT